MHDTAPQSVAVTVGGETLKEIKEAVLAGVLQGVLPGKCNLINAKTIASKNSLKFTINFSKVSHL